MEYYSLYRSNYRFQWKHSHSAGSYTGNFTSERRGHYLFLPMIRETRYPEYSMNKFPRIINESGGRLIGVQAEYTIAPGLNITNVGIVHKWFR